MEDSLILQLNKVHLTRYNHIYFLVCPHVFKPQSKESRKIFLENYTLSFHEHGLLGIYINHSLDTLSLNCDIKGRRLLLKQYPNTMGRIQRLETRSCTKYYKATYDDIEFLSVPSLQSFAVRWCPRYESTYRDFIEFHLRAVVVETLSNARNALGRSHQFTSGHVPQLFAIVSREDMFAKTPAERAGVADIEGRFII
jgi:hypothetical protein